jgi:hypothetical protein
LPFLNSRPIPKFPSECCLIAMAPATQISIVLLPAWFLWAHEKYGHGFSLNP